MSTQRYISTSFWDDEWIQSLDPSEKLLYLYYMTNPLTNIAGVYKITERRVSFDTGFNISTIQHIMQKFDKSGKVFRHGEWVVLPTWAKHQKVSERDNNRKGIDAILKSLPDDVFSFIVGKGYKYIYLNDIGRPLQGASKTLNYSDIELELESNLDIECESKEPPIESAHTRFKNPTTNTVPVEAKKMATLLLTLHQAIDPKYKADAKRLGLWAVDIEKLARIDGRGYDEIETVLRWAKRPNEFWAANIMSGGALREKFPTLLAQMGRSGQSAHARPLPVHSRTAMLDIPEDL